MNIVQVINVRWYNATAWYAINLSKCLVNSGHNCLVVGLKDSTPLIKAKELGLETIELPLHSNKIGDILACSRGIDKICKSFKPDIVNCHRGELFFLWALKKYKHKYKLVRTRGDQRLPAKNFVNLLLYKYACDQIISTNTKMSNHFFKMGVSREKVHTILGGVNTKIFYPSQADRERLRQEYGFNNNDVVIGLVGRLDPIKGFYEALNTFASVCKIEELKPNNESRLHFFILGLNCNYTTKQLYTYGLGKGIPSEQLHILGRVENIRESMAMFDAGLISSLGSETIARVAFEMIACGVPIISSRVGVMPDILDEEYLYNTNNYFELQALLLKLKDVTFREKLREECNFRMFNNKGIYGWTLESFVNKTLNIYKQTVKNKNMEI